MTEIAYSLLVHKNPKQVSKLIKNIYSPFGVLLYYFSGKNSTKEDWTKKGNNFLRFLNVETLGVRFQRTINA
jgi:hypothetical protein